MPTYYEALRVQPNATQAEIESAYAKPYDYWRRLVTHHDPDVVNRANQALQWLEKIHATLSDPAMRRAYDASLGLGDTLGGLTDPQARPTTGRPPPPPPRAGQYTQPGAAERTDAWVCSRCQRANAIGAQFCIQCGQKIGVVCVRCGKMTRADTPFCQACGVNLQDAIREKEIEEAERIRREREEAQQRAQKEAQLKIEQEKLQGIRIGVTVLGVIAGALTAYFGWLAIWPSMMERGFCQGAQLILGAVAGGFSSAAIAHIPDSPSKTEWVWPAGIVVAAIAGVLALPALVIGVIAAL